MLVRHWSCAIRSASLVRVGPREVHLDRDRLALAAVLAEGGQHPLEVLARLVDRDQPVRPLRRRRPPSRRDTAVASSGGGSAGRVHSFARSTVTSPSWSTTSPANSARMTSTHSRSRALRTALPRPRLARDVLVGELARAERDLQAAREHLRQRGGGLGDDRRVVALARARSRRRTASRSPASRRRATTTRSPTRPGARSTARSGPTTTPARSRRPPRRASPRAARSARSARARRGCRSRARSVRTPAGGAPSRPPPHGAARAPPRTRTAPAARARSRTRAPPGSSGRRSGRARPRAAR